MSDLNERFHAALREPRLIIEFDRNMLGGQALLRLFKPGASARSKPVQLLPVIVGEDGQTHADMLRHIADALGQVGAS